ncbi:MAG: hypothetical protein ACK5RL_16715 [Acidimicrobiales bacterium]
MTTTSPGDGTPHPLIRWAPVATMVIGVPSLVLAFAAAVRDLDGLRLPPTGRWAAAAVAITVFLVFVSAGYAALFSTPQQRTAAHRSFFRSQLMKYNPVGALTQATSQVALTSAATGGSAAAVATVLSKMTTGAGGLLWGPVVAAAGAGLSPLVRVGCLVVPVGVLVCHPAVIRSVIGRLPRVRVADSAIPTTAQVVRSVLLSFVGIGFAGLGFVLCNPPDSSISDGLATVAGFALTWTLGYLAIPFPGGVGVREVIATVLVAGSTAEVVVVAVIFRVTQIVVELVLTAASYALPDRDHPAP